MDMSLPVVDGWQATRMIKANPETSAIPVMALTAHALGKTGNARWRRAATNLKPSRWISTAC